MLIAYLPLMTANITASTGLYLIYNLMLQIDTGQITILFSHFVPIGIVLFFPAEQLPTAGTHL